MRSVLKAASNIDSFFNLCAEMAPSPNALTTLGTCQRSFDAMNSISPSPTQIDCARVTVSVVSHRQAHLVALLLEDLNCLHTSAIDKVIVTCNLPEVLPFTSGQFNFPVEIALNPVPRGFGANHNAAFTRCQSDWFLVINPDVRIESDVIAGLLQRATTTTGLLAPQEISDSGESVENLRGLITPVELIKRQILNRPPKPPKRYGWVKGMFMLIRSDAFQSILGFDERYFMYCEDFDLCARLMSSGWSVDHHSDLTVSHSWKRDSQRSLLYLCIHISSLIQMWLSGAFWRYRRLF
jgi:N-acetylglucosaminyl-diphospho-decaprenol L-rhamnosyltransferase